MDAFELLQCTEENIAQQWNYENGFYLTSTPNRINNLLVHYELYKRIIDLPGDIFEFGVFKGASLIRLATFRDALENDFSRKIVGFDAFGKFPTTSDEFEKDWIASFEEGSGEGIQKDELKNFLDKKQFKNITLVKGNVLDTLPTYLHSANYSKIALLHLDMDVYEPTAYVLEQLYSRVVSGGIIMIDDYNTVEGATRAVDEFFVNKPEKVQKLSLNYKPSFIIKH